MPVPVKQVFRNPVCRVIAAILGIGIIGLAGWHGFTQSLPDPQMFIRSRQAERIPLSELPPYFLDALQLATDCKPAEMQRGVVLVSLWQSAFQDVESGCAVFSRRLGRQAYIKARGHKPSSLQETMLASQITQTLSPEAVLEASINHAHWGVGMDGIQAASRRIFNTPAQNLDLVQSALLAAIVQAPDRLDPFSAPQYAKAARDRLLFHMARSRYDSPALAEALMSQPLGLWQDQKQSADILKALEASAIKAASPEPGLAETSHQSTATPKRRKARWKPRTSKPQRKPAKTQALQPVTATLPVTQPLPAPPVPPVASIESQSSSHPRWQKVKNWSKRVWRKVSGERARPQESVAEDTLRPLYQTRADPTAL